MAGQVRAALSEVDLSGSGLLLAPLLVRLAGEVDRAEGVAELLEVSERFERLVDRLNLDPGSLPAVPAPLSPQQRATAAAVDGPR